MVFNPVSTEILVVTTFAARVLRAVQSHSPATLGAVCADLQDEPSIAGTDDPRASVEALLIEFERIGLVESHVP